MMAKGILIFLTISSFIQLSPGTELLRSIASSLKASGTFVSNNPDDIHFYLYNSSSDLESREEIVYNDINSLTHSSFQQELKTVIMIHGFASGPSSPFPSLVKDEYLTSSLVNNYLVVDWSLLGNYTGPELFYPLAYVDVVEISIPIVAKRVANFVKFLLNHNYMHLEQTHIIGHSLGAHITGLAGKEIQQLNSGKKVARISGLDPAGPLFDGIQVQRKLQKGDAAFVDVYHTASGTRGDSSVNGHVDFYPNGGITQPGCKDQDIENPLFLGTCSHQFVSNIYAASIKKNFTACKCTPWFLILDSGCPGNCSTEVLAGEPCPTGAEGQYYFTTSTDPIHTR